MPLSIQGSWSVQVVLKNAALDQRFIITGAITGNGIYSGELGVGPIQVTGNNWMINVQADGIANGLPGTWIDSELRKTNTQVIGNNYVFEVESEDYIQDYNWTDLVLRFTQPIPPPPPVIETPPVIIVDVAPPTVIPSVPVPIPVPAPEPVPLSMGKVFTLIEDGDKLPKQRITSTHGIWLDATGSVIGNMVTYFTCSVEISSSYRRTIFQTPCQSHCDPEPHFSIAYGHDDGSGSRDLGGYDWASPTNAIYGQYRSICLNPKIQRFTLGNKEIQHFYAINVHRDRFGDRFDEGNFEINLHHLSGSQFLAGNGNRNAHTGSNVKLGSQTVLRLIDDSKLDLETLTSNAYSTFYRDISGSKVHITTQAGEVFFVVSGTLETGVYNPTQPHVYGLCYPRLGTVLLDADLLDLSASFLSVTGSDVAGDNSMKLFTAMSGAAMLTDSSGDYLGFQARKVKYSYQEGYFIRIKNQDYNFTNNPSYITGSEGDIITDFYDNPQVYVTQIGLYNPQHELLAVAKVNKPIYKNFVNEGLFTINLVYE